MEQELAAAPNFRTCGRSSSTAAQTLKRGAPAKEKNSQPSVPSIPSKLETVLFSGDREKSGFGSKSLRFEAVGSDNPGPGAYPDQKPFYKEYTDKDSWGKCGTGSFASKTRRFRSVGAVPRHGPGPGSYMPAQKAGLEMRSFAKTGSTPAFVPPSSVNPQSFFEGPAPGPGHYHKASKPTCATNPWKAAFKSAITRNPTAMIPKDWVELNPGPGEYQGPDGGMPSLRPASVAEGMNANFKGPSERKRVSVHPDMPIPAQTKHLPRKGCDYVRECQGAVQIETPGPGVYNQDIAALKDAKDFCSIGSSGFVDSKIPRNALGASLSTSALLPGPGQYHEEIQWTERPLKCPKSMFQSCVDRMADGPTPPAPGPCFYSPKPAVPARSFHLNIKRRWM